MKKLLLILSIALLITSCGKFRTQRIVVKGKLTDKALKSESTYKLTDAKKVLVFYGNQYEIEKIKDGKFQTKVDVGSATAMAFLTDDNKFIGNLVLSNIDFMPVVNLKDGDDTEIDLQDLVLRGTDVIPSHNPIGDEINVTTIEMACYEEISNYYKSLARNIDTDNNGELDITEDKQLLVTTTYGIRCGILGGDNEAPILNDTSDMQLQYIMAIAGDRKMTNADVQMQNITLKGPLANPYTDIGINHFAYERRANYFYTHFLRQPDNKAFEKGLYTFSPNGSNTYTFEYSSVSAKNYLIIAKPTLHADANGKLKTVTVTYELPNGQAIRPENFIVEVSIIFSITQDQRGEPYQINKFNDDATTISDDTEIYTFTSDHNVALSDITGFSVIYKDIIGNQHASNWEIQR